MAPRLFSFFGSSSDSAPASDLESPTAINSRVARLSPTNDDSTSSSEHRQQSRRRGSENNEATESSVSSRSTRGIATSSVITPMRSHRRPEPQRQSRRTSRRSPPLSVATSVAAVDRRTGVPAYRLPDTGAVTSLTCAASVANRQPNSSSSTLQNGAATSSSTRQSTSGANRQCGRAVPSRAGCRASEEEMNRRNASSTTSAVPGSASRVPASTSTSEASTTAASSSSSTSTGLSVQPSLFFNASALSRPCRIPLGSIRRGENTLEGDLVAPSYASSSSSSSSEEPPPPYSTLPRDTEQRRTNPDPRLFYPGPPPPPVIEGYIPVVHPAIGNARSSPKTDSLREAAEWAAVGGIHGPPRQVILGAAPCRRGGLGGGYVMREEEDEDARQTWLVISVVTLLLCPPIGLLCLLFSFLARRAFARGKMDVGRKRAKTALHLSVLTMALYGCALIIYLTFKLSKSNETDRDDDDDGFYSKFWGNL